MARKIVQFDDETNPPGPFLGEALVGDFLASDAETINRYTGKDGIAIASPDNSIGISEDPNYVARPLLIPLALMLNREQLGKYQGACRIIATQNIALTGVTGSLTEDGVTLGTGAHRVLLAGQTTASQNGPYLLTILTDGTRIWERTTFEIEDFRSGVLISSGDSFAGTLWAVQQSGALTVGTSDLSFMQIGGYKVFQSGNNIGINTTAPASTLHVNGSVGLRRATYSTWPATVDGALDTLVCCSAMPVGGGVLNIPSASNRAGRLLIIKDEGGTAGGRSITVTPSTGETIDGGVTRTINTAYGALRLYSNGFNWFTW